MLFLKYLLPHLVELFLEDVAPIIGATFPTSLNFCVASIFNVFLDLLVLHKHRCYSQVEDEKCDDPDARNEEDMHE